MYNHNKTHIEVNNNGYDFKYDIRSVLQYKERYIVLIGVPFDKDDINNIYCLDEKANLVWQSEDLKRLYPKLLNIAYEHIGIENDSLFATDFYGRNYKINLENGKIEGRKIVK